ncbi:MAG: N-acetylmuramoyl-L-alanine amidase [Acidimicrobiales bacterium]
MNEPVPTLFDDSTSTAEVPAEEATSSTLPTTTLPIADRLPALATDAAGAVRTDDGALLPITGTDGDVWFVLGPCGGEQIEPSGFVSPIEAQHVVLDPGGADDAAGRVNLAVAQRTAEILAADGVAVTLTRTGPVELGAGTRGAAAVALGATAFVSIQRGEDGSATTSAPRPTVFRRAGDDASRRLAGLIHQALVEAFAGLEGTFVAPDEPGVRALLNQRGEDYFRVLQTSNGVAAARVELLALGENETTLLASEEGRDIEAQALADAIVAFLVTNEEGNGFIDPVEAVRTAPTSNTPGGC